MLRGIMVSVVMLSVIVLNVITLSVIMLSVVMLSVIMLSVVMLSVVMLNVVAPFSHHAAKLLVCCLGHFRKKRLPMSLCHPPDGSTSPKYKLLCFTTTKKFVQREECTSF